MRAVAGIVRTPVLIVGGGPVGLYASALLSRFGVPSILVERYSRGLRHRRAHLINTRTMELLRELHVEPRVRALAPPQAEWRSFRYCTTLLGEQLAVDDHLSVPGWNALRAASPTELTHVSQPGLERILREEALVLAPHAGAMLYFGYECVGVEQHADCVRVRLRHARDTLEGELGAAPCIEAAQLLACDGAGSSIRQGLGIELRGPPTLQHFRSVHFRDRSGCLAARLQGRGAMLYFVFNSEVNCTSLQSME